MSSKSVNWDEIKERIIGFGVDIHPFEECSFGDLIGVGAAMEVYEGQCKIKKIPRKVAFKYHQRFKMSRLKQHDVNRTLDEFQHEIKLMMRLHFHTNVVQILGVTFNNEGKPILIVELGDETLDRYLREKAEEDTPVSWAGKVKLCLDVLRGIHGLHEAGVIHGDIKGENVLIFIETSDITAKISDFGYSSTLSSSKENVGGTPRFMAPEAMGKYPELITWQKRPEQDIYSFGLVTYQIVTNGEIPYDNARDVFEAKDADRDLRILLADLPDDTPELFRTIITNTTKFHPTDRASTNSVEQILSSFWSASPSQQNINNINLPESASRPMSRITKPSTANDWLIQAKKRLEDYAKNIGFDLDKDNASNYNVNGKITPLFWSAIEGDVEVFRILVEDYRADFRKEGEFGRTPLHLAAEYGHFDVVRLLVTGYGADAGAKNKYGNTPLHYAAENGHINIVRLLVTDYEVDVNVKGEFGYTPLHLTAERGNVEVIRILVEECGADIEIESKFGRTPLYLAAETGCIEVVKLLVVYYGLDAKAKNKYGNTALHAATNGQVEVVRLLVAEYGLDVSVYGDYGRTPLHLAAENGQIEIVRLLIDEYGADVNCKDDAGYTPLHLAAMHGYVKVVKLLVTEYGMDISVKDYAGYTPLHCAAQNGHIEVVRLLVTECAADTSVKNNLGFTPLLCAADKGHDKIVKLLKNTNLL